MVSTEKTEGGGLNIYVTGDRIVINEANFGSLMRHQDDPLTNVNQITFDGREIYLDSALVLSSARVRLLGMLVEVGPNGSIVLRDGSADREDGVEIVCETLRLSNAMNVPFDFSTDNWKVYSLDLTDAPQAGRWRRHLTIRCSHLIPRSPTTSTPADRIGAPLEPASPASLRLLTRDRFEILYGAKGSFSYRPYQISIGQPGDEAYLKALGDEMLWPFAFSSKVLKHFACNPYSREMHEFLLGELGIGAFTEAFASDRLQPAALRIRAIVSLLDRRLDHLGRPQTYVPRLSFDFLRTEFERQWALSERLLLGILHLSSQESLSAEQAGDLSRKRAAIKREVDSLRETASQLERENNDLLSSLSSTRQALLGKDAQLEEFREFVMKQAKERNLKKEQVAKLRTALDAIGVVGTVAVSAFATPAAGAGFAGGWATASNAVVGHQEGRDLSWESLADYSNRAQETAGKWSKGADEYLAQQEELNMSGRNGKTVVQQAELALKVLAKASALANLTAASAVPPLPEDVFASDTAWKSRRDQLVAELGVFQAEKVKTESDLVRNSEGRARALCRLAQLAEQLNEANQAQPTNDRDLARRRLVYQAALDRLLADLASSSANLVRAYAYLFHRMPDVQASLLEATRNPSIENDYLRVVLSGKQASWSEWYETRVAELQVSMGAFVAQVTSSSNQELNRREALPLAAERWDFQSDTKDKRKQLFLEELNSDFRRQIGLVLQGKSAPVGVVGIPADLFFPTSGSRSELLRDAFVTSLRLNRALSSDLKLSLSVLHPGYGQIGTQSACVNVTFDDSTASGSALRFPSTYQQASGIRSLPNGQGIYVPYPLRSNYFLLVELQRDATPGTPFSTKAVPKILGLSIDVSYWR
ncbi:MAG: hypothetical protein AB2L07_15800 [Thermoanaerobaculaceae bacterium]